MNWNLIIETTLMVAWCGSLFFSGMYLGLWMGRSEPPHGGSAGAVNEKAEEFK